MLNVLFPSLPYQRVLDPFWQEEADEARQLGYTVCLYDAEQHRLYYPPVRAQPTLYRGWMLTATEYEALATLTPLFVSSDLYQASHYATGWYEAIAPFTPPSIITPAREATSHVQRLLEADGRCFVKGLTKSFGQASVITSLADFSTLCHQQALADKDLLMVRTFVALAEQAEARYFVIQGSVFGAAGQVFPAALQPAIAHLRTRWFYTIDVAYTQQGQPLIIEIGDGQVSDTKEWLVPELYQHVLQALAQRVVSGLAR
ncbi:MAG: ATP-grasp domain-containing protein [Janthinobacterium lividum]